MFVLQAHPKTATDALEELSSLLQVPLVVSAFFLSDSEKDWVTCSTNINTYM